MESPVGAVFVVVVVDICARACVCVLSHNRCYWDKIYICYHIYDKYSEKLV